VIRGGLSERVDGRHSSGGEPLDWSSGHGSPVPGLQSLGLTHLFPSPSKLARANLGGLGLPLDGSATLEQLIESITAIPGLGPWTAHYLAFRVGEPDDFPATDLWLRRSFSRLPPASVGAAKAAEQWRPWRSHAAIQLWLSDGYSQGPFVS
jgi:3-methyladenine DNA glycosylase/8-oxoguanine DNA glycosylase